MGALPPGQLLAGCTQVVTHAAACRLVAPSLTRAGMETSQSQLWTRPQHCSDDSRTCCLACKGLPVRASPSLCAGPLPFHGPVGRSGPKSHSCEHHSHSPKASELPGCTNQQAASSSPAQCRGPTADQTSPVSARGEEGSAVPCTERVGGVPSPTAWHTRSCFSLPRGCVGQSRKHKQIVLFTSSFTGWGKALVLGGQSPQRT